MHNVILVNLDHIYSNCNNANKLNDNLLFAIRSGMIYSRLIDST